MIDASQYTIAVRKAEVDGESTFEARVREFPDVTSYGETAQEAYEFALDAIETLAATADAKGKTVPPPQQESETASGRVTLRLPKSIHARAIQHAESEGISLNTYLVSVISQASSFSSAYSAAGVSPEISANYWPAPRATLVSSSHHGLSWPSTAHGCISYSGGAGGRASNRLVLGGVAAHSYEIADIAETRNALVGAWWVGSSLMEEVIRIDTDSDARNPFSVGAEPAKRKRRGEKRHG